jgi:hypothetical protein
LSRDCFLFYFAVFVLIDLWLLSFSKSHNFDQEKNPTCYLSKFICMFDPQFDKNTSKKTNHWRKKTIEEKKNTGEKFF